MAYSNIKVSLSADIQDVWEFVTNLNQQLWRRDVASVEILDEKTFIEYTPEGYQTTFTITVKDPFQRYEFDMENTNMKGHWVGVFAYHDGITTLDFTENVEAKKIFMKPFVKGYLKKQQTNYINDLKDILIQTNKMKEQ
ncbi:SRPBCC family protein [Longibaculum muris]|uniref:SRPBCC family protein n=1 Tax=Longibaculum muris TaxID=1796628 RepID=UPI0022E3B243|nr:SRPBCC family protein [Longibaculum muris]